MVMRATVQQWITGLHHGCEGYCAAMDRRPPIMVIMGYCAAMDRRPPIMVIMGYCAAMDRRPPIMVIMGYCAAMDYRPPIMVMRATVQQWIAGLQSW